MNIEIARARIAEIIAGARHKDYDEVQEVTELSEIIHADESGDLAKELRRYRPNEDSDLFRQRLRAFNPISRTLLQPTYSYTEHIRRSDSRRAKVVQPNQQVMTLVTRNFERFYNDLPLTDYLFEAVDYANKYDPNLWIGFERENVDTGRGVVVNVYPVEFSGTEVVDFGMSPNGQTRYMCAMIEYKEKDRNGRDVEIESYFFYGAGFIIRAVKDDKAPIHTQVDASQFERRTFIQNNRPVQFLYREIENGTQETPFFRAGAFRFERHNACEMLVQSAVPVIRDLIRDASFLAVHKTLHIFPERAEYVRPCTAVNQQNQPCISGYYDGIRDAEHYCNACAGTGKARARSEQEVIQLAWDENMTAEQFVELNKLVHYFDRPLNVSEFYVKELERAQQLVFATTYNQNNITPAGAPRTATEVNIQADMINNVLVRIAKRIEVGFELAHRIAFQYYNATAGAEASLSFGKDFKVVPLEMLIATYQTAKEAGVPRLVLKSIEEDMIEKSYPDWPMLKDEITALNEYKPFDDKEPAEVQGIILSRAEDDPMRVRWENWSEIERLVQRAVRPRFFHELTPERRDTIIDAVTIAVQAQVKPAALVPDIPSGFDMGDMTDGEDTPEPDSDNMDDNDADNIDDNNDGE